MKENKHTHTHTHTHTHMLTANSASHCWFYSKNILRYKNILNISLELILKERRKLFSGALFSWGGVRTEALIKNVGHHGWSTRINCQTTQA